MSRSEKSPISDGNRRDADGAAIGLPGGAGRTAFARVGRNVGWLVGGRGFAGVVSLGYLALAARALGPRDFGAFSLVLAYGGAAAALAQFQSWMAVLRYGSIHVGQGRADRLATLLGFTLVVDLASAVLGAALAALGIVAFASLSGRATMLHPGAAPFVAILVLSTGTTASGLLRLRDRFDLLTYCEATGPIVRLLGAAGVWAMGGGIGGMLVVWALAAVVENGSQWIAALAICRARFSVGGPAFRRALAENPRLWRFMIHNSIASTLGLLGEQAGTLAVGGAGGSAAAGAFRVASKLSGGLAQAAATVARALYPELARLVAGGDAGTLRYLSVRLTAIAVCLSIGLVTIIAFYGRDLLQLLYGPSFGYAQPYLLVLTIATAIGLCGLCMEPILNARGLSGRIVSARVLGAVAYVAALVLLIPSVGTLGAAYAAVASAATIRLALVVMMLRAGDPRRVATEPQHPAS